MTCKCISSETLAAWVDGALDPADARDVACHVAICATCQQHAALLRCEVDALRGALGRDKAPPAGPFGHIAQGCHRLCHQIDGAAFLVRR